MPSKPSNKSSLKSSKKPSFDSIKASLNSLNKSSLDYLNKSSLDMCQTSNIIFYISQFIAVILYIVIIISLSNIEKLSNCDCSKLPYKDYIKEWFIFLIIYMVSLFIIFSLSDFKCYEVFLNYPPLFITGIIISLITLVMLIRLFIYLNEIRKNCNCAYGNKEAFLYWFLIIYVSIIILLISISVILIIMTFFLYLYKYLKN